MISEQQTIIGDTTYDVYTKDTSVILTISDKNTEHLILYQLSIKSDNINISSDDELSISITLSNFSEDFKLNIINRYNKYLFYVEKYNAYMDVQSSLVSSKTLYVQDIIARVEAYETKIEVAKSSYPGLFDSSIKKYYNEPIAKYIKKYQLKINTLHDLYYNLIDDQYIIDIDKISENDIISYRNKLKEKYESLDNIHIVPVVTMPSKALLARRKYKYRPNEDGSAREGRWKSKWIDNQLQYYKKNYYPVNIHKTRMFFGTEDKTLFAIDKDSSILEILYNSIISGNDCVFTVSSKELHYIYSELVLKTNADGDGGFGGRYNIKRYKQYLLSINQLDRLKYFNFKYLLVDMHTTRKYVCKSDIIKYSFSYLENLVSEIFAVLYPAKKEYWAGETFDKSGLQVFGICIDDTTKNVTDQCAFKPFYNLPINNELKILILYDNGEKVIYTNTPLTVNVKALIPKDLLVYKKEDSNPLLLGLQFNKDDIISKVIVSYEDVSTLRDITNSNTIKYEPAANPMKAGENLKCKIIYTENNIDVSTSVLYDVSTADPIRIDGFVDPAPNNVFKPGYNVSHNDWKDTIFNILYNNELNYAVPYVYKDQTSIPRFEFFPNKIEKNTKYVTFNYIYSSNSNDVLSYLMPIIISGVKSIYVKQNPNKMDYLIGDEYDLTGMVLSVIYEDDNENDYEYDNIKNDLKVFYSSQENDNDKILHDYYDTWLTLSYLNKECDIEGIKIVKVSSIKVYNDNYNSMDYYPGDYFSYSSKMRTIPNVKISLIGINGDIIGDPIPVINNPNITYTLIDKDYEGNETERPGTETMTSETIYVKIIYKGNISILIKTYVYYRQLIKVYIANYGLPNILDYTSYVVTVNGNRQTGYNYGYFWGWSTSEVTSWNHQNINAAYIKWQWSKIKYTSGKNNVHAIEGINDTTVYKYDRTIHTDSSGLYWNSVDITKFGVCQIKVTSCVNHNGLYYPNNYITYYEIDNKLYIV